MTSTQTARRELGRGRSGVVTLERGPDGAPLARKLFESNGLTKLVQVLFLGSPNPYVWNESAVECAFLRRRILSALVPVWFGPRLRVAEAVDYRWNSRARAFELRTRFSPGRPALLHHPLRIEGLDEARELGKLLDELQGRLQQAGFDGMLWQAGRANPVAWNNFLREEGASPDEPSTWVWIDLESGVPALAPMPPWALFTTYLPLSWRHGHPLFDEVDADRLRDTLEREATELAGALGEDGYQTLIDNVKSLADAQKLWKSHPRHERAIDYQLARGRIDEPEAARFRRSPTRWYARESVRLARKGLAELARLPARAWRRLASIPLRRILAGALGFLTSQKQRESLARNHVAARIATWRRRRQMTRADADFLRGHLYTEESSNYLTDFVVQLALKPPVKAFEFWVAPALFAMGWIDQATLGLILVSGGPVTRTLYTLGRLVQSTLRGHELPWIALLWGMLPVVGNFAYPMQLLYSSTEESDDLARFILHDGFARIGAHIPIWGGKDTRWEHALNRLPDRLFLLRGRGILRPRPRATDTD